MSDTMRVSKLNDLLKLKSLDNEIEIVRVLDSGAVYVRLLKDFSAATRGTFLLDFEDLAKRECEIGINVWLEPIGDRNSLRKLRGIRISN